MKSKIVALILTLFLLSCKTQYSVQSTTENRISISDSIPENTKIVQLIQPYKEKLDLEMNRVLTYNPINLDKNGPNFTLGIFVTDFIMNELQGDFQKKHPGERIDAVLMNTGGLRRTFTPGNLTVRSIFELMPFENELVVVTLSPEKFIAMVNHLNQSESYHPISGFSFHKNQEELNILVNSKPFDSNRNYNVVTNDYLQKGGNDMKFFEKPIKSELFHIKLRDLFVERLNKIDTIKINQTTPRYILN